MVNTYKFSGSPSRVGATGLTGGGGRKYTDPNTRPWKSAWWDKEAGEWKHQAPAGQKPGDSPITSGMNAFNELLKKNPNATAAEREAAGQQFLTAGQGQDMMPPTTPSGYTPTGPWRAGMPPGQDQYVEISLTPPPDGPQAAPQNLPTGFTKESFAKLTPSQQGLARIGAFPPERVSGQDQDMMPPMQPGRGVEEIMPSYSPVTSGMNAFNELHKKKPSLPQPGQTLAELVPSGQGHAALPPPVGVGPGGNPPTTQPGQDQDMMPPTTEPTTPAGEIEAALDKANQANIARYEEGLGELRGARESARGLYGQAFDELAGTGKAALSDINRGYQRMRAQGMQDLISRGLGSTTITMGMERAVQEDRARQVAALQESLARQRSGLLERQASTELGATTPIAGFIERREDAGPDTGLYADILREGAETTPGMEGEGGETGEIEGAITGAGTVDIPGVNIPGYSTGGTTTGGAAFNPEDTTGAFTPQNVVRKRNQMRQLNKEIKQLRKDRKGKGAPTEEELEKILQWRELRLQNKIYEQEQARSTAEQRYSGQRYRDAAKSEMASMGGVPKTTASGRQPYTYTGTLQNMLKQYG